VKREFFPLDNPAGGKNGSSSDPRRLDPEGEEGKGGRPQEGEGKGSSQGEGQGAREARLRGIGRREAQVALSEALLLDRPRFLTKRE
jgi:hypothetical protein